jgi:hypothetical protein
MATFPSIRIEGGLLGPDLLDQLLAAQPPGQKARDFGLDGKRNLTDEIASVFADTRALWEIFQHRLARLPDTDLATSVTRDAWMIPFLGLLGYELKYNQRGYEVDGLTFAISHRAGEPEDSPPIHIVGARQELGRVPPSGRPRLAPHSLVQEYLNRTESLWGLVTNGSTLRLLRDTTFVRRQAYVEFDLRGMIEERRFEDFAALYRLLHRTRLPKGQHDADKCLLEKYYSHSVEQGGRVRDHLRDGVELTLTKLANGFLRHPSNDSLRRRISPECSGNERITAEHFYQQVLRIVYRFLFLLVAEDRGLLGSQELYRKNYGVGRLRQLVDTRAAYTHHDDIWRSLRVLWRVLIDDTPRPQLQGKPFASALGLTVLNGDLFAPVDLDDCSLSNDDLLEAFWSLVWYDDRDSKVTRRVNYAALDVEELGSVYESLIEFHPSIQSDGTGLHFTLLAGTERKSTGSYYTPPQLVNELIQSALDPVMRDRLQANAKDKEKSILSIRVCDPACGSGHFLLAAARHLGKELARVRTSEDEPPPERIREAIRDVISHCIYGVDKNALAVDLCRVALWIESYTEDKPLTFLDHRIRCGDSLVGVFDLACLTRGIPDKAFDAVYGDDRVVARETIKRNRDELRGQFEFRWEPEVAIHNLVVHTREIDNISDDTPEEIRRKKRLFEQSHQDETWVREKEACDLWTSAFFQTLRADTPAITNGAVIDVLTHRPVDGRIRGEAEAVATHLNFFHWPLEFPEVFENGGFDVVLGNPPWERIKLQEQEFFATRDAAIAMAPNKAARVRLIKDLPEYRPELWRQYGLAMHDAEALSKFLRRSERFALTARGDINTYAIFAEHARTLINGRGRAGIIVQSGVATDDTCKHFFSDLLKKESLISFFDFVNLEGFFPGIHRTHPHFCALTMAQCGFDEPIEFSFYNTRPEQLRDPRRRFVLTSSDFEVLNPNTRTCPIFRTRADADLTRKIYERVPVLVNERTAQNPWGVKFATMFHMANDSGLFRVYDELIEKGLTAELNRFVDPHDNRKLWLPLYEAKMMWQFDHRFATYEEAETCNSTLAEKQDPKFAVSPRYWVEAREVYLRSATLPAGLLQAIRDSNAELIPLSLAHLIFGNWLLQNGHNDINEIFRAWGTFVGEFPFARQLAPTQMGLCGNNPACFSPLDGSYIPAVPVNELKLNARESTPWYAVDPEAVRDFLEFAATFRIVISTGNQINDTADAMRFAEQLLEQTTPNWFLGFRDVTNATNERTAIFSVLPRAAFGHKMPMVLLTTAPTPTHACCFLANVNTLVFDYVTRQKIGGTSLGYFILKQLPIRSPSAYTPADIDFIFPRVLELVYTGNDLKPFAKDCGYDTNTFKWNEERRALLRAELDAYYAKLYGLTRDELRYILDPKDIYGEDFPSETFRVLKEKELRQFGEYRTRRLVLEAWDRLFAG